MGVAEWPLEAIAAVGASILGNLVVAGRFLWQLLKQADARETRIHEMGWSEVRERDHQIDLLRRMLDRCRRRESAYATCLELACLGMKLPAVEQAATVLRIREILSSALPVSSEERS